MSERGFWTTNAWALLVDGGWATVSGTPAERRRRTRRLLLEQWEARIERAPSGVLAPDTRVLLRAQALGRPLDGHGETEGGDGGREGDETDGSGFARTPEGLLAVDGRPRLWGGYEQVLAAAEGEEVACWFLEQGALGWLAGIDGAASEGTLPEDAAAEAVMVALESWRLGGQSAGELIEGLDAVLREGGARRHPVAGLARVPFALWAERDARRALGLLEAVLPRLGDAGGDGVRGSALLTLGMALALDGDLEGAQGALRELEEADGDGTGAGRGEDEAEEGSAEEEAARADEEAIRGLFTDGTRRALAREAAYQRARLGWASGRLDTAAATLGGVLGGDAAYVLRLVSDPAWRIGIAGRVGGGRTGGLLDATIDRAVGEVRERMLRWQQGRQGGDEALAAVRAVRDAMSFAGEEAYPLLGAGTLLPAARRAWLIERPHAGRSLEARLSQIRGLASLMPAWLGLRLGTGFAPRFAPRVPGGGGWGGTVGGGDDGASDLGAIQTLADERRWPEVEAYVEAVAAELPLAATAATLEFLERVAKGLAAAGDELLQRNEGRRRTGDDTRMRTLLECGERAVAVTDLVSGLPTVLTADYEVQMGELWGEIDEILRRWITVEGMVGGAERRVEALEDCATVDVDGWGSVRVRVVEEDGTPAVGASVLWRVLLGRARPVGEAEVLDEEWATTMEGGVAHLLVQDAVADGEGGKATAGEGAHDLTGGLGTRRNRDADGVIEVRVLGAAGGSGGTRLVRYRIGGAAPEDRAEPVGRVAVVGAGAAGGLGGGDGHPEGHRDAVG